MTPDNGYWYAGFNTALRDPSTTGGVVERGQYGIELYRIPDTSLLTGATPWELLTNSRHQPDWIRIEISSRFRARHVWRPGSRSGHTDAHFDIESSPAVECVSADRRHARGASQTGRYLPLRGHRNPSAGHAESLLQPNHTRGHDGLDRSQWRLFSAIYFGTSLPKSATGRERRVLWLQEGVDMDYFVSLDSACEGARILGMNGYGYSGPVAGLDLVALYRCSTSHGSFRKYGSQMRRPVEPGASWLVLPYESGRNPALRISGEVS